tara:strand:+ start:324 stop:1289 length:966 start_codon:yes stop_codon:yes gene_type:complete
LEGQILLYYLKVFSLIISFIIIFLTIYIYILISKNIEIKSNILKIDKGENIKSVINKIYLDENFLEKFLIEKSYVLYSYLDNRIIHYGNFYFNNPSNFFNIVNIISKPTNFFNKITIIEGWTKNDLEIELLKFFDNIEGIEYHEILADTYYFEKNRKFKHLYNHMTNFKEKYLNKYFKGKNKFKNFSKNDIMIIGSLLEKEGLDYNDKKKISSVIFNRLSKNMRLQIDATVLFAITDGQYDLDRKLYFDDLKYKHPYNTYLNNGLPPSPISFVGTKTIDIIFEMYSSEYLFYFYNSNLQSHIFSKNYEEHKKKLNEYRNSK